MDVTLSKTFYVVFVIIYLIRGNSALRCHHCSWSARPEKCENVELEKEKLPPYPVVKPCVPHTKETNPPTREYINQHCDKEYCSTDNAACMKWSFISGSPENITYMCVNNPGNRRGCYEKEISEKDKEKEYNKKTLRVEVCLCDKDLCNSATRSAILLNVTLLILVTLSTTYLFFIMTLV